MPLGTPIGTTPAPPRNSTPSRPRQGPGTNSPTPPTSPSPMTPTQPNVTPTRGTQGGYNWQAPAQGGDPLSRMWNATGHGDNRMDQYRQQYGQQFVDLVQQTGLDPEVYLGLGPAARRQALDWGTNLENGNARLQIDDAIARQTANQQAETYNNDLISQFDLQQQTLMDQLANSVAGDRLSAQTRYDRGNFELERDYGVDLGMLNERELRDVGLERAGLADDSAYLNTMRDVAAQRFGLTGERTAVQNQFLDQMMGALNQRRGNAYDQYQTNDAYAQQQALDNNAQYGFTARDFTQNLESAQAARHTNTRNTASDATARGAFGSAGFNDSLQDIAGQFGQAIDGATLNRDQSVQSIGERDRAIGNSRENARFGYNDQVTGFNETEYGLDRSYATNDIDYRDAAQQYRGQLAGYDRDQGDLDRRGEALDSIGREYGLRREDMANQLDNAIVGRGLDLADTNRQLDDMLNSGNAELIQQGMQFMQMMMAYQ